MTAPSTPPHPPEPAAHRYDAQRAARIETAWQDRWAREGTFVTPNPGEPNFDPSKPKFYCLDMFPYPSGAGLHVGHPEGYTATDIICRYKRMRGFNVLHPMGWDAFGLPAEQYAIQTGVHPAKTTRQAIETFRRQLQRFGFSYDWSREFATIDPDYYKWTQWIFLRLYHSWYDRAADRARPIADLVGALERGDLAITPSGDLVPASHAPASLLGEPVGVRLWHELSQDERRAFLDRQRLAFVGEQTVNWCPRLGTVLANEEVIDGRSERGGHPVHRRALKQWMLRITAYAERLARDAAGLDWPESTRTMQIEWIGRSEGAEIDFPLHGRDGSIRVYTTRPDTIFGASFMVVAPEHPLVDEILAGPGEADADVEAIGRYVAAARARADVDRMADAKEKTGVFSGLHALNPATGTPIPVWIADYVLMGYGHGAIMAVPAHDERDLAFAERFGLPIRDVVYSRTALAMRHFALHAPEPLRAEGRWIVALADFLGLVTTESIEPPGFGRAMATIASRRADEPDPTTCHIDPATYATELPGAAGADGTGGRRGVTRLTWLDAIETLGFTSFDDLAERFLAAGFHRAAHGAFEATGFAANSSSDQLSIDGLRTPEAKEAVIAWLERVGLGRRRVNFKLRDWLFSRQRYWGEPFPIAFDARGHHHPIDDAALPVLLPDLADFRPPESDDPAPMLAAARDWLHTTAAEAPVSTLPPESPLRREANTMPNWAGSCWYYLRFCDPHNSAAFASPEALAYWMGSTGIDLYIGGSEHAVLHLLYARFWHKVLFDLGLVPCPEPAARLFHQGMITSYAYQRSDKSLVPADAVDEPSPGRFVERATGEPVVQTIAKMSKTLKNVINPDDVIAEYGADTMRLYEMYMGPLDASKPWNPRDIVGCHRFLQKVWRLLIDEQTGTPRPPASAADPAVERALHRLIAKVGPDIERLAFNTAIAAMMEFIKTPGGGGGGGGGAGGAEGLTRDQAERFVLVLAPFAPHLAEELWSKLGHDRTLAFEPWPAFDPAMLRESTVELAVQVMGKVRGHITVPADADHASVERAALAEPRVRELIEGKTVRKVVVVPGKLVNIVAG
ncbi:MAG: leucine--tRNA ligase [Phycisphaerae bacterium]|nr:leucine--tRNA ligase [Phycisphaerae bacterium]